jgi:hypothetical protein
VVAVVRARYATENVFKELLVIVREPVVAAGVVVPPSPFEPTIVINPRAMIPIRQR